MMGPQREECGDGGRGSSDAFRRWKKDHKPKNAGRTLEAGKGKETDSSLGPLAGTQLCQHLDLNPQRPISDFPPPDLYKNKFVLF